MQNRKTVREEIEVVNTMRTITQAYEEISIMRMQKIRDSILRTRDFLLNLSGIYYDVKNSHRRYLNYLVEEESVDDLSPFSVLPQNGKKLAVFFSANERMNGDIISKVCNMLITHLKANPETELAIVGRVGKELYVQRGGDKQFSFFHIPDDTVKLEDVTPLLEHIVQYQEIDVFYGLFKSVVTQEAVIGNITGDKPFDKTQTFNKPDLETQERKFLYEPTVEEINNFFETQIFAGLLKHSIDESHLARYASRITAMEEASENIKSKAKKLLSEERKIKKSLANKRQQNIIAGMALWTD